MFKLKWNDIDFERGFIFIRNPKGGKSRKIPLNRSAREVFNNLSRTSKFVFPGRGGKQRVDINKPVNEIKRKADLPKNFRPLHGLRHVYASIACRLRQGGHVHLAKTLNTQNIGHDATVCPFEGWSITGSRPGRGHNQQGP